MVAAYSHTISHQAGFIPSGSQGNEKISSQLKNLVSCMMWMFMQKVIYHLCSGQRREKDILNYDSWGGSI